MVSVSKAPGQAASEGPLASASFANAEEGDRVEAGAPLCNHGDHHPVCSTTMPLYPLKAVGRWLRRLGTMGRPLLPKQPALGASILSST